MLLNNKFLFIFLFFSLSVQSAFSDSLVTAKHPFSHDHIDIAVFKKIIDYPLQNKTLEGIKETEELLSTNSNVPAIYVLNSYLHINFMFNHKTYIFKKQFLLNTKKGLKLTRKWLRKEPKSADAHFFHGALIAYKAILLLNEKKTLGAINLSFAVLRHMRKAINLGDVADAYYVLSQYHYYKYQFSKRSIWFQTSETDLQKGYDYLQKTISNGVFMQQDASMAYITMRINDSRLDNLENIINEKIVNYPNSKFYLMKKLYYYLLIGNWEKMIESVSGIEVLMKKEPLTGQSAYLELNYYLVISNYLLGRYEIAKKHLKDFDENRKNLDGWHGNKSYIKRIKAFRKAIKKSTIN